MSSSPTDQPGNAPKHRACDECRTRKLACSKQPEGCYRCRREGIPCHYSPQKQMGRPRKRARDESRVDGGRSTEVASINATSQERASKSVMTELPPDTADPGIAFINMLLGDTTAFDQSMSELGNISFSDNGVDGQQQEQSPGKTWDFGFPGSQLGDVNYDMPNHSPSFPVSNLDPALFVSTPNAPSTSPSSSEPLPAEQVPELSPNSASSPESNESSMNGSSPTCDCTGSLYRALDSMAKLPDTMEPAIRQARLAAKAAYEVVNCPVCSTKVDSMTPCTTISPSMIRNFQNLMLLATLIPSIVHAYERILHFVDQETNRAVAERRQITFKLNGFGGVWGPLAADKSCGGAQAFHHLEMEPIMWRLTVRALLKVDVYGISCDRSDGNLSVDPFHIGLKDIVQQMETKSRARHQLLDHMVKTGVWQDGMCFQKIPPDGETPTCLRVIEIARSSIDKLVIA